MLDWRRNGKEVEGGREGRREGGRGFTQGDDRIEDEQEVVKGSSRWVGLVFLRLYLSLVSGTSCFSASV